MKLHPSTVSSFYEEKKIIEQSVRSRLADCWIKFVDQLPPANAAVLIWNCDSKLAELGILYANGVLQTSNGMLHLSIAISIYTHWTYIQGPK